MSASDADQVMPVVASPGIADQRMDSEPTPPKLGGRLGGAFNPSSKKQKLESKFRQSLMMQHD